MEHIEIINSVSVEDISKEIVQLSESLSRLDSTSIDKMSNAEVIHLSTIIETVEDKLTLAKARLKELTDANPERK